MYIVDLHTHSNASDGQYSPSELVKLAYDRGIEVLALTDHDTLSGLAEAACTAREVGIRFVRGVELSAREYHTFHILGYGAFAPTSSMAEKCDNARQGRKDKALRIIDYLYDKGMRITMEEIQAVAGEANIGRPHFARLMLDKGYISNYREAFDCYLDTDEYHDRVEIMKQPVARCIEKIKISGGKAVLAHPYQIGIDDEALEKLVRELIDLGLDGIECYYPKYTREMTKFYLSLAKRYGLHVTGGSDFHGEKFKPEIELVRLNLDVDWLIDSF